MVAAALAWLLVGSFLSIARSIADASDPHQHDHGHDHHHAHGHGGTSPPAGDGAGVGHHGGGAMAGHERGEGIMLVAQHEESVAEGGRCPADAPRRTYDVAAIAVDLTLNRYLDHDPNGRMYVLEEDLAAVREEEAANERARTTGSDPAVSLGLQGDAIQPLTLRVLPGECLLVRLRNALPGDEPASFHVHGSQLIVADTGRPAVAAEPSASVQPGETVTYEWAVPVDEPEGTHHVHSHGDTRRQTAHGLFGGVVVEPPGAAWTDALTGEPETVSWAAVVSPPGEPAFREFVIYYHEIGTESFTPLGADDAPLQLVDPFTGSYRPSSRALNYRSEPFMHRLQLQVDEGGVADESIAYSSYAFGDPATPVLRTYVGEPVKQRVVHSGSEVFHVHHVHGGSIRWPRQPGMEGNATITELEKRPPLLPSASERTDSQSIGPSEAFDVEPECGAGGCQQSVGDLLFHCHVAHHYISGMWGIWRVYNTLQDGVASTDQMPPLPELPDRSDVVLPAVTSDQLPPRMRAEIATQLPPRGEPREGNASVWDWRIEGGRYVGEPEDERSWPGHVPGSASRPPLLFDPRDGRLAYPHLRPHLGRRPPFAPGHGPAPYLDPGGGSPTAPRPGENGDRSVCPAGARLRELDITAIDVPIPLNREENLVDPAGMLFVRREQRDAVIADPDARVPLVLRTNAAVDCVDVTLTSEVADDADNGWLSKVNAHIHFVQFDVQGSDGVDAGFNYEQSVRPWTVESERILQAASVGSTRISVARPDRFRPGSLVMVGVDTPDRAEIRTVRAVRDGTLLLREPLEHPHGEGERVTEEFVRYRWYPDVQFGTAFFHDHVNAIFSGRHGLWGALIAEPPDATWHDPDTGEILPSGAIADIRTEAPISHDVAGSFRELVVFLQDDNPVTKEGRSSGSSLGLRVEPLDPRMEEDPATAFDSTRHGDPETAILRAHPGDPIVLRTLVSAANDVHTIHLDGHAFRSEPWSPSSSPAAGAHVGISERLDLVVPSAGGPARLPGDYLLRNGRASKAREGSWGLLRVLPPSHPEAPLRLPGNRAGRPRDVCPASAPVRSVDVAAVEAPLPMLDGDAGVVFAPTRAASAVAEGRARPEPLVVRATVGDCIELTLRNRSDRDVSLEPDLMVFDPMQRAVGRNGGSPVPPGGVRVSRLYAHPSFGEATVLLLDGGDPLLGPASGSYGAIAVAERGSRFLDPVSGRRVGMGWEVTVLPPTGPAYRDAVLFLQEQDAAIGTHLMPYRDAVDGAVGINYHRASLGERSLAEATQAAPEDVASDAMTPVIEAYAGDPMRLRVLVPSSEQGHVFSVEGHRWALERSPGASKVGSVQMGALEAVTIDLEGGAGGPAGLPGTYVYGDHREPFREAGLWGLLRVREACPRLEGLLPLPTNRASCAGGLTGITLGVLVAAGAIGIAVVALGIRRRRSRSSTVV